MFVSITCAFLTGRTCAGVLAEVSASSDVCLLISPSNNMPRTLGGVQVWQEVREQAQPQHAQARLLPRQQVEEELRAARAGQVGDAPPGVCLSRSASALSTSSSSAVSAQSPTKASSACRGEQWQVASTLEHACVMSD